MRPSPRDLEVFAKFGEFSYNQQSLVWWGWVEFFVLQDPGVAMGDKDGVESGG